MLSFMEMSYEEALAHREAYVAALPGLVQRLRQRLAGVEGLVLDGSVESLCPLGRWFVAELDADTDDGLQEWPLWWDPQPLPAYDPYTGEETRYLSPQQLRRVDEVAAYLGTVLQAAVPGAEWIVYREKSRGRARDSDQHWTMLRGPWASGRKQISPVVVVYGQGLDQHMYQRGQDPDFLHRFAAAEVDAVHADSGGQAAAEFPEGGGPGGR